MILFFNVGVASMLYWTDWGKKPRIESAWMDGQHREVLVGEDDLGWPTGLVVDYLNGNRIYWCDAKENIIESIKPDGSEREIIISGGVNSGDGGRAEYGPTDAALNSSSAFHSLQTWDIPTAWTCLRATCTGRPKTREKCGR